MTVPITIVDAFTSVPFRGNPAAVCVLSSPRDGVWMQDVAREMSLSETAFVSPRSEGFDLRWFTPAVEVELCGHATIASAPPLVAAMITSPWRPNRRRLVASAILPRAWPLGCS